MIRFQGISTILRYLKRITNFPGISKDLNRLQRFLKYLNGFQIFLGCLKRFQQISRDFMEDLYFIQDFRKS